MNLIECCDIEQSDYQTGVILTEENYKQVIKAAQKLFIISLVKNDKTISITKFKTLKNSYRLVKRRKRITPIFLMHNETQLGLLKDELFKNKFQDFLDES